MHLITRIGHSTEYCDLYFVHSDVLVEICAHKRAALPQAIPRKRTEVWGRCDLILAYSLNKDNDSLGRFVIILK